MLLDMNVTYKDTTELVGLAVPDVVQLINYWLGRMVVPFVSILCLICNALTVTAVYVFEIDRATLLFVVLVSIADFCTTICNGLLIVSFPNWGWFDLLTYSESSCQILTFFLAVLGLGAQNELVLMSMDRFLAVSYSQYSEKLMRNLRYPLICTIVNYALTTVLSLPILTYVELNEAGHCIGKDFAKEELWRVYGLGTVLVVFTAVPVVCILLFNAYTIYKLRRDRSDLRDVGLSRTPEEEIEYWITVGCIYICGSFLLFTCGAAFFQFKRQSTTQALRKDPNQIEYYDAYMTLYRNLGVLFGVTNMIFAFVFYIIQNKNLRSTIVKVLHILFISEEPQRNSPRNLDRTPEAPARQETINIDPIAEYPIDTTFNRTTSRITVGPPELSIAVTMNSANFEAVNQEVIRQLESIFGRDDPELILRCRDHLWELAEVADRYEGEPQRRKQQQHLQRQKQQQQRGDSCKEREGTGEVADATLDIQTRRVKFEKTSQPIHYQADQ